MGRKAKSGIMLILLLISMLALAFDIQLVKASPKSLYLVADHHTAQFDAWNINPNGTVTYQATYWLSYATDPAGISMDESSVTLFITSEFSGGVEMVDATTMTSVGVSPGPSDLAGIDVDDANDIVYCVQRYPGYTATQPGLLYIFDWNVAAKNLTLRAGYPKILQNCQSSFGIALDESRDMLWVADPAAGVVRAYDVTTCLGAGNWTEDTSKSFTPSHKPVDVAVDRRRGFVYTVSMSYGAYVPPGCGSNLLSKYDLATLTETTGILPDQGVGVAVDEVTGFAYITLSPYGRGLSQGDLDIWDTSTTPWTNIQTTKTFGSPAGIYIPHPEVAYNPLNLRKCDIPDPVAPGDTVTYIISFNNTRIGFDVHNVVLIDTLPEKTIFVSASDNGTYNPTTHTVTWNIGTLVAGASTKCVSLVVGVKSSTSPGTTIYNYATIAATEISPTTVTESTDIYIGRVRFGPRINNLLIKMYANDTAEFEALEAGEIDILDSPLTKYHMDRWSQPPYTCSIVMKDYGGALGMFVLDINNNQTIPSRPGEHSPTSDSRFRHALAHLIDRDYIVNTLLEGLALPIYTPVPPALTKYLNTAVDKHPYNVTEAAAILDTAGYVDTDPDGWRNDPFTGQNVNLTFYYRTDHAGRTAFFNWFQGQLTSIGIYATPKPVDTALYVMTNKDYHLYTGGWTLGSDPDFLYLYHSSMYTHPGLCANYGHFNDTEYDYYSEMLMYASNIETAITAAMECQRIMASEGRVGVIPLWTSDAPKAYRKYYGLWPGEESYWDKPWVGFVNELGLGVDSWWAFLNAHAYNKTGGTLRYGFRYPTIYKLNPVYLRGWDWKILDKIYDTLLKYNPNTLEDETWMVYDWEIGTWYNPTVGKTCTKLTFHLESNIVFHDGVQLTSKDVKFTIGYLKNYTGGYWYSSVKDVHHVETPDLNTVIVYENILSIWTLHWIGRLPILPKHVWQTITDPTGFQPDPDLIGIGPFKFIEYVPNNYTLLSANSQYFRYLPPDGAISGIVPLKTVVGQGLTVEINAIITNQGNYAETFDITIYANKIPIGTKTVTLTSGDSATLTFTWNTTGVAKGNYTIKAEATILPGETDTLDNTHTNGWIIVAMIGDISSPTKPGVPDGKVDMADVGAVARLFGINYGNPQYNPNCDITGDVIGVPDGKIDMRDIGTVARNFGKTDP